MAGIDQCGSGPDLTPLAQINERCLVVNYFMLVGSSRKNSQSAKVGSYVADVLEQMASDNRIYTLSLEGNPLPLWEEGFQNDGVKWRPLWQHHSEALSESQALIIITPEWSGMAPSGVKNFFLLCTAGELAHKPALIIGVSATRGGSYPVAELRMSSYKNTHVCYIPDHVIVHNVGDVLNAKEPQSDADRIVRRRIAFGLGVLEAYGQALADVRAHPTVAGKEFRFGM
jgi:NAD(P)H-dependent FMN reductase